MSSSTMAITSEIISPTSAMATMSSTFTTTSSSASSSSTDTSLFANAGSAQENYGQSLSTFISSLTASLIIFGIEVQLFSILRKRLRRVYEPKTYAVPRRQRVRPAGRGLLDWLIPTLFTSESEFMHKCGLDAYFFIRYLAMLIFIFFCGGLFILPILLPINSAGTSSGTAKGLDKLAWVNIGPDDTHRYWAHLILAVLFIFFLCFVFYHEMQSYIRIRQNFLISPTHRLRASATTVLIRAVPGHLLDVDRIKQVFRVFPGGVRNVWISRNVSELQKLLDKRDAAADKLESAETALIRKCQKVHQKRLLAEQKKHPRATAEGYSSDPNPGCNSLNQQNSLDSLNPSVWARYIKPEDRPHHRVSRVSWIPFGLPGLSDKVDTIDWCREKLNTWNPEIVRMQSDDTVYPHMHSVFIQFNRQIAAHMACQSLASESAQYMSPRLIEINPRDIIWNNMRIKWGEALLRSGLVHSATTALVVGWAFPVAFVGIISQLDYLTAALPFLDFLNDLGSTVKGIISGILPPAALAILMALLPIILRFFAYIRGSSTGVFIELSVQQSYFSFLFVQVFLVITISSSITTVIQDLTQDPTSVPSLLAQNLPKSSNFFFSYLILQGLTVSAGALLRVGPLIVLKILGPLLDNTARKKFNRITSLNAVQWGTFYPIYTNLGAIGIVYAIISPLIIPMSLIAFILFYIAYRYEFMFCNYNPIDSSGLFFPRAINQLFVGIYVMELCLIGLFFLVRDSELHATCTPQAIIMIVLFFATLVYQYLLNRSMGPLLTFLPISLENRARAAFRTWLNHNEVPLLTSEQGTATAYHSFEEAGSKKYHETSDLELQTQKSPGGSSSDEELLHDIDTNSCSVDSELTIDPETGAPIVESPMMQLLALFSKPIKTVVRATTPIGHGDSNTAEESGQAGRSTAVSRVVPSVVASGMSTGISGVSTGLSTIRRFVITGQGSEDLEFEIMRNSADAMLLEGVAEDLEDLTKNERESLVNRAFTHQALRAKRPTIWIPHDDLGVSEDEIQCTLRDYPNVLISDDGAALSQHGKVTFSSRPPDFDIKSKIAL
ncbi:uncharacterized protein V1516DRAFT_689876 [Lipomyces oligophaga]|uniref:uncharacterized protein n=1 Tax=Lipomyces oligophaga TaxID=45792 RepID=UPI0034CE39D3